MFFSGKYKSSEDIMLATIAWMAIALGIPGFEEQHLNLPEPDTSWWNTAAQDDEIPGIVIS